MRNLKIVGLAVGMLASALVGGTLMSAVLAHPSSPAPATSDPLAVSGDAGEYCQTFLTEFAKQLGVEESALLPAAKAAANAAVDKAVADGKLTKDVADKIKERIANADGNGCGILGAKLRGLTGHGARAEVGLDLFKAAADALHLTTADLRGKLVDGKSLKQIAQDQQVEYSAVTTAVHNAAKTNLDKMVSAGNLTQARETEILDRLDQALKDGKLANGHFGIGAFGHFRGFLGPKIPAAPQASPSGSSS